MPAQAEIGMARNLCLSPGRFTPGLGASGHRPAALPPAKPARNPPPNQAWGYRCNQQQVKRLSELEVLGQNARRVPLEEQCANKGIAGFTMRASAEPITNHGAMPVPSRDRAHFIS